jgi:hypothetical protein
MVRRFRGVWCRRRGLDQFFTPSFFFFFFFIPPHRPRACGCVAEPRRRRPLSAYPPADDMIAVRAEEHPEGTHSERRDQSCSPAQGDCPCFQLILSSGATNSRCLTDAIQLVRRSAERGGALAAAAAAPIIAPPATAPIAQPAPAAQPAHATAAALPLGPPPLQLPLEPPPLRLVPGPHPPVRLWVSSPRPPVWQHEPLAYAHNSPTGFRFFYPLYISAP